MLLAMLWLLSMSLLICCKQALLMQPRLNNSTIATQSFFALFSPFFIFVNELSRPCGRGIYLNQLFCPVSLREYRTSQGELYSSILRSRYLVRYNNIFYFFLNIFLIYNFVNLLLQYPIEYLTDFLFYQDSSVTIRIVR